VYDASADDQQQSVGGCADGGGGFNIALRIGSFKAAFGYGSTRIRPYDRERELDAVVAEERSRLASERTAAASASPRATLASSSPAPRVAISTLASCSRCGAQRATFTCPWCMLGAYCSQECFEASWERHSAKFHS
jgi:hypothetical protein